MSATYANETLRHIAERFSCRDFTDELPTREQLEAIAQAAVAAPSAMNFQPWRVIVLTNKDVIDEIEKEATSRLDSVRLERINSRGGKMLYNAPCMFIVLSGEARFAAVDCGILCENITIAARSLGLSSLICAMSECAFQGEKGAELKKKLGFPEGFEFAMSVLVGKSAAPGKPHEPDKSKITFVK